MTVINKETVESSGHSILQDFQGKGYGNLLFSLLVEEAKKLGFKRFTGWISENNIGSIKNVEHSGFVRTDEFRFGRLEAFDREDKFYKYELIIP
jgi:L-amino acid N-acyltransferase YncA